MGIHHKVGKTGENAYKQQSKCTYLVKNCVCVVFLGPVQTPDFS